MANASSGNETEAVAWARERIAAWDGRELDLGGPRGWDSRTKANPALTDEDLEALVPDFQH
ncbi:MAG: hypothetical protein AAFO79_06300, partial [Pseudomonadota bacterium]